MADPLSCIWDESRAEDSYLDEGYNIRISQSGTIIVEKPGDFPRAIDTLRRWFDAHRDEPYPTTAEKRILARASGLSDRQIAEWFSNARDRSRNQNQEATHSSILSDNNEPIMAGGGVPTPRSVEDIQPNGKAIKPSTLPHTRNKRRRSTVSVTGHEEHSSKCPRSASPAMMAMRGSARLAASGNKAASSPSSKVAFYTISQDLTSGEKKHKLCALQGRKFGASVRDNTRRKRLPSSFSMNKRCHLFIAKYLTDEDADFAAKLIQGQDADNEDEASEEE